jgi:anti-sigma regulatory factor (Ser/Thr protein kinase)
MTAQLTGKAPYERRQLVITARESELSDVRRHVRDSMSADVSVDVLMERQDEVGSESGSSSGSMIPTAARIVADLELVTTELATNVIHHTDSDQITVAVQRVGDTWVIEVDGADALAVADTVPNVRPPDVEPTGRGLLIVYALTDSVELVERDGHRLIRCLKRIC